MYYALVRFRNECDGNLGLLFSDTRAGLASELLAQCEYSFDEDAIDMIECADEDGLDCYDLEAELGGSLEDYFKLRACPSKGKIQGFGFEYSGSTVEVITFSASFPRIAAAFNWHAEDSFNLFGWIMKSEEPEDPAVLDAELRTNEPTEAFFDRVKGGNLWQKSSQKSLASSRL